MSWPVCDTCKFEQPYCTCALFTYRGANPPAPMMRGTPPPKTKRLVWFKVGDAIPATAKFVGEVRPTLMGPREYLYEVFDE